MSKSAVVTHVGKEPNSCSVTLTWRWTTEIDQNRLGVPQIKALYCLRFMFVYVYVE